MFDAAAEHHGAEMIEAGPTELDDVLLTPAELAARWRVDVGTLANLRARGEGLPFIKLPSGPIRYKAADVLDAEREGCRGFSWARVVAALETVDGLDGAGQAAVLAAMRKAFK